jgi:hypothetical protein
MCELPAPVSWPVYFAVLDAHRIPHSKKKCDGVMPRCSTCAIYKVRYCISPLSRGELLLMPRQEDCRWEGHVDYRKPVSREEVTSLRSRIAELERQLKGTQRSSSRRSRLVASPEQGMEYPVDHALFLPDQADHPISEINTDLSSSVPAYIEVSPPRSHPKRRVTGNPLLGELETIMVSL